MRAYRGFMSINPPRRRSAAYRLPGVFVLALLGGGGIYTANRAEQQHRATAATTLTPRALLWLHVGSADVVITHGAGKSIRIVRDARWVGGAPHHSMGQRRGGRIDLVDDCSGGIAVPAALFAFHDDCSVSYRVRVPAGQAVRVDSGSGDIRLTGLSGRARAATGSGDISAAGLTGRTVLLASGSGDVSATLEQRPASLRATTGSGDISLRVPGGRYRIDASTGSGDRSLDRLTNDPASTHAIYARTGSGDVSIGRSDR
jgi:hypothetical protein